MPKTSPIPGLQINTDPLVFGRRFKYSICRQNQRSVVMKNLTPGSIILFGCVRGSDYLVDTVFVVSEKKINFTLLNPSELQKIEEYEEYRKLVLDTFFNESNGQNNSCGKKLCIQFDSCGNKSKKLVPVNSKTKNTYYEGATYNDSVYGMYSFIPAKVYDKDSIGFERLKLTISGYQELKRKNLQNFCTIIDSNQVKVKEFWDKICEETEKQGLIKAIEIQYPN